MSAAAISYVWDIKNVTAEERLALLWLANNSAALGDPVCPEWIGMGEFMCCHYERAAEVVHGLSDRGLIEYGQEEDTRHYIWIAYGGPLNVPHDWTSEPRGRSKRVSALIDRDGPNCAYCDCLPVNYEVDHFIPRAKGGRDAMDNLVLACPPCNRAKRDKNPEDFLRDRPERFRVLSSNLEFLHA